ncbi:MAG: Uma2 family endonuclease [Pirellulaceae bacterium]
MNYPIRENLNLTIPPGSDTLGGFRRWVHSDSFPDRGHVSLIAGEMVIDMNAERLQSHNKLKGTIGRVLATLIEDLDLGEYFVDGLWLTNDAAELSTVPDGTFVSWESLENGRAQLLSAIDGDDAIELSGSPDWVLEVVSPSSIEKDTRKLVDAYYRAGVREYWIVDALGEDVLLRVLTRGDNDFTPVESTDGWVQSKVFAREFRLTRRRHRLGTWHYTLAMRAETT